MRHWLVPTCCEGKQQRAAAKTAQATCKERGAYHMLKVGKDGFTGGRYSLVVHLLFMSHHLTCCP